MNTLLDNLKLYTKVVADTGDWAAIDKFKPDEATTNPTLVLKVLKQKGQEIVNDAQIALEKAKQANIDVGIVEAYLVAVGRKILEKIPGRLSTEVDARLSFNTEKTIENAANIIKLYELFGVDRKRILIKIAATWEGIQAAKILEKCGISCNLTLIFSKIQAIACAEAEVTLISPFVGRVSDWYKEKNLLNPTSEDQGVSLVKDIFNYYKARNYSTEIMGASFRNVNQIISLAGCDRLTISPELLAELSNSCGKIEPKLLPPNEILQKPKTKITADEFRFELNNSPVATEKLAEGIRLFSSHARELELQYM